MIMQLTWDIRGFLLQNADLPLFALPFSKEIDQKEEIKEDDISKR